MSFINSQGILRDKSRFHNEYESLLKLRHLETTLLHHQSHTRNLMHKVEEDLQQTFERQLNEMKNRLTKMEEQLRNGK